MPACYCLQLLGQRQPLGGLLTRVAEDVEVEGLEPLSALLAGLAAWPPPPADCFTSRLARLLAQFR